MEDKIKITKDLRFDYDDLMQEVDISCGFTMRDILAICVNSKIPMKILSRLIRCNYIKEYYNEANSKKYKNNRDIDCLEVYWWGTKYTYEGVREDGSMWSFHGLGKKGYVPEDVLEYGNLTDKEKEEYQQAMAIEFTPMYNLADIPIKINRSLYITDYDSKDRESQTIDFQPSIKLIELLYAIFWELSFCGSPKQRNKKLKSLNKNIASFKKAKKEGTLKLIDHEKVKINLEKKINDIKKNTK